MCIDDGVSFIYLYYYVCVQCVHTHNLGGLLLDLWLPNMNEKWWINTRFSHCFCSLKFRSKYQIISEMIYSIWCLCQLLRRKLNYPLVRLGCTCRIIDSVWQLGCHRNWQVFGILVIWGKCTEKFDYISVCRWVCVCELSVFVFGMVLFVYLYEV